MRRHYLQITGMAVFGAWAALLAACTDALPTTITPDQGPSFLAVGKCQTISSDYADGNVSPANVAYLKYGTVLQVCCEKVGTATITSDSAKPLTVSCTMSCPVKSMVPVDLDDSIATMALPLPQQGIAKPSFECHDQGGG